MPESSQPADRPEDSAPQLRVSVHGGGGAQLPAEPPGWAGLGHGAVKHPHGGAGLCEGSHEQLGSYLSLSLS